MKQGAVIGAGSWGTAICVPLSDAGAKVFLWGRNKERLSEIEHLRENKRYLPGVTLPKTVKCEPDLKTALQGAGFVIFAVPAQHFAEALENALPYIKKDATIVNLAKGIERGTFRRMSEIAKAKSKSLRYVALSGPSHAEEVSRRKPTSVTAAAENLQWADGVCDFLMTENFRIYTSGDLVGVELGGALKNVLALGAGISDGFGCGVNAKAALMTRGLAEMTRLGVRLGADPATFSGLSGIGDLIVTCCSEYSRNYRCGLLIGKGISANEAESEIGMVAEGVHTADAALSLAEKMGVEMPITQAVCGVVRGKLKADEALKLLMTRARKREGEGIF